MQGYDSGFYMDGVDIKPTFSSGFPDEDDDDDTYEHQDGGHGDDDDDDEDSGEEMLPTYGNMKRFPEAGAGSPNDPASIRSLFLSKLQQEQNQAQTDEDDMVHAYNSRLSPQQKQQQQQQQQQQQHQLQQDRHSPQQQRHSPQQQYQVEPTMPSTMGGSLSMSLSERAMAQPSAAQHSPQSLYAKASKSAREQPVQSDFLRDMLMKEKALAQQRESAMQQELAAQEASENAVGDLPWDQTEDYYGEEEEYADEGAGGAKPSADDDVKPMPKQFYSEVDSFLKAGPPPSLQKVTGSKKRGEMEASVGIMRQAAKPEKGRVIRGAQKSSAVTAPQVASRVDTGLTKSNSGRGSQKRGAGASGGNVRASTGIGGQNIQQGPLDVSLLQEAFQYTQQLMEQAANEELDEETAMPGFPSDADPRRVVGGNNNSGDTLDPRSNSTKAPPRSAPNARGDGSGRGGGRGRGGGGRGGGGSLRSGGALSAGSSSNAVNSRVTSNLAKKLRGQTAAYSDADRPAGPSAGKKSSKVAVGRDTLAGRAEHSSSFSTSRTSQDDSGTGNGLKHKLDYAALVANFESGNTLKKLQEDLQRSQASAQESAAFTRKAMMEANFQH